MYNQEDTRKMANHQKYIHDLCLCLIIIQGQSLWLFKPLINSFCLDLQGQICNVDHTCACKKCSKNSQCPRGLVCSKRTKKCDVPECSKDLGNSWLRISFINWDLDYGPWSMWCKQFRRHVKLKTSKKAFNSAGIPSFFRGQLRYYVPLLRMCLLFSFILFFT